MLSQHFTKPSLTRAGLSLIGLLSLAACSTSGTGTAPVSATDAVRESVSGQAENIAPQAQALFDQAASVMASGDLLEAELRFKELLLQYPAIAAAHVNLAIIYANNGDLLAARAAVDDALAIDPAFAPALNQLGVLLRKNGKFVDAEAAYMKAITVSPDYALAHYNLGVLNELYLQRLDVALRHFEKYQSLAGEDEQVDKWIADLERRVAANQRTANVTR